MPLSTYKILFVEDDEDTQKYVKLLLEDDISELYQAYDGIMGLELFKEKKPDIIITDINMPRLSGLEFVRNIRHLNSKVPIIMMSAHDDKENLFHSINLGVDGFITKPIDINILYEKLHKIVEKNYIQNNQDSIQLQKIEELHKLAYYDTLTGVANRFLFDKTLDESLKNKTEFALFFIDLDHFKSINDTYGHEAGDVALQSVVESITNLISEKDFLARRSGDEFLLIINDYISTHSLQNLATRVLENIKKPFTYKSNKIQLTASIGVSIFPRDSRKKSELLRLADAAMYYSKNSGKARFNFASSLSSRMQNKQEKNRIIINKNFYWDVKHSCFILRGKEILLTKNEMNLLSLLFSSPYYKAEYNKIYTHIWGMNCDSKNESLKTLVKQTRAKLPVDILKNIFGIGYKIEVN